MDQLGDFQYLIYIWFSFQILATGINDFLDDIFKKVKSVYKKSKLMWLGCTNPFPLIYVGGWNTGCS